MISFSLFHPSTATMASQQHHIVMLPFMAQGHLIPFLSFANLISQRHPSYTITIVNTPLNVRNLQPLLSPNSNIHLSSLPFETAAADHGLPPNSENTDSLPDSLIMNLMLASETLEPHFDCLVSSITNREGRPPVCIVSDVFCSWAVNVARKHNIFQATFSTCGAYGTAAYMSMWLSLPHFHTSTDEFNVPCFPESVRFHCSQVSPYLRAATGSDPGSNFFRRHIRQSLESGAMLCNTVEEVECVGVQLLRNFTGQKVWTIGPLLRRRAERSCGVELDDCIKWLDSQVPASVLYISFGSQNRITASQMMALARGLEASGKPFIWVVRPPLGFNLSEDFREEWLPEGLEARMKNSGQGLLVRKWAPQLDILSHKSTGAFLSHCGWNSILETVSCGVPVIGWPLAAEQFYNSKMLEEELGVGVEVARGVESEIASGDVEKVIELVMGDCEKGREVKEKVVWYSKMMRAAMREGDERGSSIKAVDGFLQSVTSETCRKRDEVIVDGD